MIHDRLTDYQVADAFGDTLSLIYKDKMAELNEYLEPINAHLDSLMIPKFTDFDRWFARETVPIWAKEHMIAIEHIQKIRNLYRNMKKEPESDRLDIEKAKAIPLTYIYPFVMKRGGMTHCCFHTDNTPSMKINKNGTAKCFSCGWYGDGIKMFMDLNEVSFKEAVIKMTK